MACKEKSGQKQIKSLPKCHVRKTARIRNRYNQVPHLSQDTKWESDKSQLGITNNLRAKRSALYQQVTTRQQWTNAKAWQTQDIDNTNDPQKKYWLGTVSKKFYLKGLNWFTARQPHP